MDNCGLCFVFMGCWYPVAEGKLASPNMLRSQPGLSATVMGRARKEVEQQREHDEPVYYLMVVMACVGVCREVANFCKK